MHRILLGLAACVLGLSLTAAAPAHEPARHYDHGHTGHAYYHDHGVRFSGGYYYRGYDHHHWSRQVWDPVCHRYQYYDPYLQCYYYWSPERNCYYPVGY